MDKVHIFFTRLAGIIYMHLCHLKSLFLQYVMSDIDFTFLL